MTEINLLDRYPRSKRPIAERAAAVPRERAIARQFGREYFDGERTQGYGGYRYDGRWLPIAERMRDHYGITPGDTFLDVGCAKGFLVHDFQETVPGARCFGLDISAYALANAVWDVKPNLLRGTADALPFADNTFDLVVSINTLHNLDLPRCERALREIQRVSRKGSYVQVDSWLTEEQHQSFERWQLTAVTYFDPEGWRDTFHKVGYTGDFYWTLTE